MRSHTLPRAAAVTVLALAAALPAHVALGIAKIGNVVVAGAADGADGGEVYTAAEGTERVFVRFDYTGASRTDVTVRIIANGLNVFEETKRYNDSGTATIEVTGAEIIDTALATMSRGADEMTLAINGMKPGTDITAGEAIQGLNTIDQMASQITNGLPLFEGIDLDKAGRAAQGSISDELQFVDETVAAAQKLPPDDIAGRQSYADEMKTSAGTIGSALDDLSDSLDGADTVTLPTTGEAWGFDVTVRTETASGSAAAGSARFSVYGTRSKGENEPDEATARASATTRGNAAGGGAAGVRATATPRPGAAGGATPRPAGAADNAAAGDGATDASSVASVGGPRATTAAATAAAAGSAVTAPGVPAAGGDDASGAAEPASPAEEGADDGAVAYDVAQPTWTVPAGGARSAEVGAESAAEDAAPTETSGGGGPNFLVLGLGLAVLIAVALWYRNRA